MRRSHWVYVGLFVGSFGIAGAWYLTGATLPELAGDAGSGASPSVLRRFLGFSANSSAAAAGSTPGFSDSTSLSPAPSAGPSAEDEQKANLLASKVFSSQDPAERRQALEGLTAVATPDALHALQTGIQSNDTALRYMAVDSLRQLGSNTGDPDGRIRSSLAAATQDRDPDIAFRARAAIEEIDSIATR